MQISVYEPIDLEGLIFIHADPSMPEAMTSPVPLKHRLTMKFIHDHVNPRRCLLG